VNSQINRRRFLKTSATLAGAAVLTPLDLAAVGTATKTMFGLALRPFLEESDLKEKI